MKISRVFLNNYNKNISHNNTNNKPAFGRYGDKNAQVEMEASMMYYYERKHDFDTIEYIKNLREVPFCNIWTRPTGQIGVWFDTAYLRQFKAQDSSNAHRGLTLADDPMLRKFEDDKNLDVPKNAHRFALRMYNYSKVIKGEKNVDEILSNFPIIYY